MNIINNYGVNQIKTSDIIITYDYYALKIFAHETIIPTKELARIGKMILDIFNENNFLVNKIIATGFSGKPDSFTITKKIDAYEHKQYKSTLELLKEQGYKVITIGKATKIFNNNEMTNICKTNNDIESIVVSVPMMTSQAYSVAVVKVKDTANVEKIKQEMLDNIDMRRWICVSAEQLYITNSGNVIFSVMADKDIAKAVYDDFKKYVNNNIGKELEKSNDEENIELPPEMPAAE